MASVSSEEIAEFVKHLHRKKKIKRAAEQLLQACQRALPILYAVSEGKFDLTDARPRAEAEEIAQVVSGAIFAATGEPR